MDLKLKCGWKSSSPLAACPGSGPGHLPLLAPCRAAPALSRFCHFPGSPPLTTPPCTPEHVRVPAKGGFPFPRSLSTSAVALQLCASPAYSNKMKHAVTLSDLSSETVMTGRLESTPFSSRIH